MEKKYFIVRNNCNFIVFDVKTQTKQFLDYLIQVGGPPNNYDKKIMSNIMDGNLEAFNDYFDCYNQLFARINSISVYLGL